MIGNYVEVLAAACEFNRLGFELFGKLDDDSETSQAFAPKLKIFQLVRSVRIGIQTRSQKKTSR